MDATPTGGMATTLTMVAAILGVAAIGALFLSAAIALHHYDPLGFRGPAYRDRRHNPRTCRKCQRPPAQPEPRVRLTMYTYLDRSAFLDDTTDENMMPGYVDRLPWLPAGSELLSVAVLPAPGKMVDSYPDAFTLLVHWRPPS